MVEISQTIDEHSTFAKRSGEERCTIFCATVAEVARAGFPVRIPHAQLALDYRALVWAPAPKEARRAAVLFRLLVSSAAVCRSGQIWISGTFSSRSFAHSLTAEHV